MDSNVQKNRVLTADNARRGIYLLPNLVTSASLFAGFYSLVSTLDGKYSTAAVWIFISAICDGLDGKIARMTSTSTKFGVEYDSLADAIAFGVTPALMVYSWALKPYGRVGWLAAALFATCGALRLARFNVQVNVVESKRFVGLPIPAGGCMLAATVLFAQQFGRPNPHVRLGVIVMTYLLAFLMVSNVKYYSFKDPALIRRQPFGFLMLALVLLIAIWAEPVIMTFAILFCYVLSGPLVFLFTWPARRRQNSADSADQTPPANNGL
ncbi:MAG TPA: CDP-diacylglycerol--serine O-phosphatidyltransferase [Deltaproteobacteria bacterium]|nr:CDP-diacylglycerol--serine O-phosphatidyltransferase [Deltaproteobacteria bacterium]